MLCSRHRPHARRSSASTSNGWLEMASLRQMCCCSRARRPSSSCTAVRCSNGLSIPRIGRASNGGKQSDVIAADRRCRGCSAAGPVVAGKAPCHIPGACFRMSPNMFLEPTFILIPDAVVSQRENLTSHTTRVFRRQQLRRSSCLLSMTIPSSTRQMAGHTGRCSASLVATKPTATTTRQAAAATKRRRR